MKASKLFLTVVLCSGLAFGYGLLGCGDDEGENGRDDGCTVNADCDDGLFCNGTETCDAVLDCVAGVDPCDDPLGCDEDNDECTGCVDDADCDDDLFCNGVETCLDNVCQAGTPEDCDDGVACTVDSCNEDTDACVNTPDDGECDDGLFCNGTETCDAILDCVAGVDPCDDPLGCDEDNDECTGCVDDADCDDDLFCNGEETCLDNVCQAGTPVDCDDGVGCTVDSCNEDTDACDNTPDDGECDDGLFCNGAETCDALLDCVAGVDPCPDPLGCDEENDQCEDGPSLLPAALLSVASGCETFIGAHPLYPQETDPAYDVVYTFCDDGTASKQWNPDPLAAQPGPTDGDGTWSVDPATNELRIVTEAPALNGLVTIETTEVYDTAFTYDGGTKLDLNSAAQVPAGDGSSVVGNYERHASIVAVTSGAANATVDSTADTTMTVGEGTWEATLVEEVVCTGNPLVCGSVPPGGTTPTSGTFTMPGELYEFDGTYVFQVDDTLVLERQP